MQGDIVPFISEGSAGQLAVPDQGRFAAPHWLSQAGQDDRRNEGQHVVAVRQLVREVERARLEVAKQLARDLDEMEAETRVRTEQKYYLHRAHKESQILAGEDPELRAKFAILDDDLFSSFRRRGLRGSA